jgi:hypothetical protein
MTDRKRENAYTDDLLRRVLGDDLPPDVQAGMRQRAERFLAERRAAGPSADRAWYARRPVWAAVSILMLLAGILLQGKKPSTPLAERISSLKAAYASFDTGRR